VFTVVYSLFGKYAGHGRKSPDKFAVPDKWFLRPLFAFTRALICLTVVVFSIHTSDGALSLEICPRAICRNWVFVTS